MLLILQEVEAKIRIRMKKLIKNMLIALKCFLYASCLANKIFLDLT